MSIRSSLHAMLHHDGGTAGDAHPEDPEVTFGNPSPGEVMSRGAGELGEMHDRERDEIATHTFGSPNDGVADHVRPPLG